MKKEAGNEIMQKEWEERRPGERGRAAKKKHKQSRVTRKSKMLKETIKGRKQV